jgi:squalene-hopene/tetraprenyl-beta-curcumene cyclase
MSDSSPVAAATGDGDGAAGVCAAGTATAVETAADVEAAADAGTAVEAAADVETAAVVAARRARDHLLSLQAPQGWWKGELETNVTMEAEDLMLRRFLGILTPAQAEETGRWVRARQQPDGTWATFHGGPSELSTTVEAYVALRIAGDDPSLPHMQAAAAYIRACGGLAATRVFTRLWLALFGQWSWDDLPVMPVEMIFLPSWFPLNVYDFGCWARQTVVPLTVVGHFKPVRPLGFTIDELKVAGPKPPTAGWRTWEGRFQRLDALLHRYDRRRLRGLRELALRRAAEWIVARQEADGCWGGIQPPWVYSIIALHLLGYPLDHPVPAAALAGLERYTIREQTEQGPVRRLEACQSPVWDTALAVVALADAGLPGDHPAQIRAARWLADEEVRTRGDWAVRRPELTAGGWAFEFDNDGYPDVDDTAEVVIAIRRLVGRRRRDHVFPVPPEAHVPGSPGRRRRDHVFPVPPEAHVPGSPRDGLAGADPALAGRLDAAVDRGVDWSVGMRSANGAWGAFDADNTRTLPSKLPFCDFGEVIDPPSADVTAHMVEMLAEVGRSDDPITRRGVQWLLDEQEPDGSWFGRWGVNYVYGTGAVVPALVAAGVPADHPAIRAAVRWLVDHQDPGGGWGEDLRSYRDPGAWAGRGTPTASQTAWALLALLAADPANPAVRAGVSWLCQTQRADGTWDEPPYTGTGFPWDFSINYHLYRLVFPLTALGRYVTSTSTGRPQP